MVFVPGEFAKCTVLIECQPSNDTTADKIGYKLNEEIEITLGLGTTKISQLIDRILLTLTDGDKFELDISQFELGCKILNINLIKFTFSSPIYQLEPEEILDRSKELKEKGTEAFRKKEIEAAFYLFGRALKYLLCLTTDLKSSDNLKLTKDQQTRFESLKCLNHLNLAACQLLGTNLSGAIINCEEALKIEPANIKAHFRIGQAKLKMKEYESAITDLKKVLELDPNNKQAVKCLKEAKVHLQEDNKHLGDKLKNMFG